MQMWLADYLVRWHIEVGTFFRAAYMWKWGKDIDVSKDVQEYNKHRRVPEYVQDYMKHIQQKEVAKCCANNAGK